MGGFFWHGYCCMMLNRILTGFVLDLPIVLFYGGGKEVIKL